MTAVPSVRADATSRAHGNANGVIAREADSIVPTLEHGAMSSITEYVAIMPAGVTIYTVKESTAADVATLKITETIPYSTIRTVAHTEGMTKETFTIDTGTAVREFTVRGGGKTLVSQIEARR